MFDENAKINGRAFASLLMMGVFLMYSSTFYIGGMGAHGRIAVLAMGFAMMVFASFFSSMRVLLKGAYVFLAAFVLCLHMLLLEHHTLEDFRSVSFYIILVYYCFSGVVLVEFLKRKQSIDLEALYSFTAITGFISSSIWFIFIRNQTFYLQVGRNSGDESLHPVGVSYVSSIVLLFLIHIVLYSKRNYCRILSLVGVLLLVNTLVLSASRGAIFSFVLALLLMMIQGRKRLRGFVPVFIVASFLVMFAWILNVNEYYSENISYLLNRFTLNDGESIREFTSERDIIWGYYIEQFDDFWLLGLPRYGNYIYPHNLFLEAWVRFGLVGIVAAIALTVSIVVSVVRSVFVEFDELEKLLVVLGVYAFLNAQFNLSLDLNRILFLVMPPFFYMSIRRKNSHG